MNGKNDLSPATLAAFVGSMTNLPKEEIQKAKRIYILNAIEDFKAMRASARAGVVVLGIFSIIPIFLIIFIPALISYRRNIEAARQKILNAIEVWKDDMEPAEYTEIQRRLQG